jgi:hypothetical protein
MSCLSQSLFFFISLGDFSVPEFYLLFGMDVKVGKSLN